MVRVRKGAWLLFNKTFNPALQLEAVRAVAQAIICCSRQKEPSSKSLRRSPLSYRPEQVHP